MDTKKIFLTSQSLTAKKRFRFTQSCAKRCRSCLPPTLTVLDAGALKAWLSPVTGHKIQDARVAIIGCNRLGREVARCLANSGVCSGPSGRVIFIDGGDTLRTGTGCGAWSRNSDIAGVERGAGISSGEHGCPKIGVHIKLQATPQRLPSGSLEVKRIRSSVLW